MNFGIIGCGAIAAMHANAIGHIDGAELIGAYDARSTNTKRFAEEHDCTPYESFEAMLADKNIDTVCICTPSWLHAENALAALKAGKHVILEKPMAINLHDAEEIMAECKRSKKKLTVISQLLYEPDVQKAKNIIESGELGRIVMVDLSMKYYRTKEYFSQSTWRGKISTEGGGALMNQGIHGVSLMQYLVGDVKHAEGRAKTLTHSIEVEDTVAAFLEFECGALGVITATTSVYPGYERLLTICGEKGSIVLKENALERIDTQSGKYKINPIKKIVMAGSSDPMRISAEGHIRQIKNFINACEGKEDLLVDIKNSYNSVKLILDIYNSSK